MAHDLSKESGRYEMFYAGETPWHGLGIRVDENVKADEAIRLAGLDWQVDKRRLFFNEMAPEGEQAPSYELKEVPFRMVTVRADTETPLGVVGNDYQVIQNAEAFGFFDAVVGDGKAVYHTAGALGNGRHIWMLAQIPGEIVLENDREDVTEKYLLLTTGHDGSTALRMLWTPTRVVCRNTLNAALGNVTDRVFVHHTGDVKGKVEEAQRILGLANEHYEAFAEQANWLSRIEFAAEQMASYLADLFPMPEEAERTDLKVKNVEAHREEVAKVFEVERGRTVWHLANAAVQYVDHGRTFNTTERTSGAERRFSNVLLGDGARTKGRAWDLARDLAESIKG
jgi:phage/plasmid-like protein (TIGR03299 family)